MQKTQHQKNNDYWKARLKAKEHYLTIRKVVCPALNNESVVFNAVGFTHLVRKGGVIRPEHDQIRRFHLLKYVVSILNTPSAYTEYRKEKTAEFWAFEKVFNDQTVTVVVRQADGGQKHFFSVMDEKYK